jgi:hypothetical protein
LIFIPFVSVIIFVDAVALSRKARAARALPPSIHISRHIVNAQNMQ